MTFNVHKTANEILEQLLDLEPSNQQWTADLAGRKTELGRSTWVPKPKGDGREGKKEEK